MKLWLFTFFCISISFAQIPDAITTDVCKKCTPDYRVSHHFSKASQCRGCLFKIYDQLNRDFLGKGNREIYCGCPIYWSEAENRVYFKENDAGCSYQTPEQILKKGKKDSEIDIEHVVPKSRFHQDNFYSNDFRIMFPAIRRINVARNTKEFCPSKKNKTIDCSNDTEMEDNNVGSPKLEGRGVHQYGSCETTISIGAIYPRNEVKGEIGRAYLYMDSIGALKDNPLDANEKRMFTHWHENDPPDAIECTRELIISEIQGGQNTYISKHPACAGVFRVKK